MTKVYTIPGVDYSRTPNLTELVADGNKFVGRYILGPLIEADNTPNLKVLTQKELDFLHTHNVAILAYFETTEKRALTGKLAGINDANAWVRRLRALGCSDDSVAAVPAIDFNATNTQMINYIGAYFQGWRSVVGFERTWAYGGGHQLSWLFDRKLISGAVQAKAAYSWGPVDERANVMQEHNNVPRYGGRVDLLHASSLDGMWKSDKPAPKPVAFHYVTVTKYPDQLSTLSGIAAHVYGTATEWPKIYQANKAGVKRVDGKMGMIVNSDDLQPGWELLIP